MMDIKGDFGRYRQEGEGKSFITERHAKSTYIMASKLCTIEQGTPARDCFEFGPVLFSQILDLNDTQAGVMSVIFKYCDDNKAFIRP
jgi:hypothetical protein